MGRKGGENMWGDQFTEYLRVLEGGE